MIDDKEKETNEESKEQTVFTEDEAKEYGAFVETALSEKDVIESSEQPLRD